MSVDRRRGGESGRDSGDRPRGHGQRGAGGGGTPQENKVTDFGFQTNFVTLKSLQSGGDPLGDKSLRMKRHAVWGSLFFKWAPCLRTQGSNSRPKVKSHTLHPPKQPGALGPPLKHFSTKGRCWGQRYQRRHVVAMERDWGAQWGPLPTPSLCMSGNFHDDTLKEEKGRKKWSRPFKSLK